MCSRDIRYFISPGAYIIRSSLHRSLSYHLHATSGGDIFVQPEVFRSINIRRWATEPVIEKIHTSDISAPMELPLVLEPVPAGFPSPADDFIDSGLDLNQHLIRHPAATFFVRVSGDSMIGAGIHSGDLLVVDRALTAADDNVVIAAVDGELTVKRLRRENGIITLVAENSAYPPLEIVDGTSFEIWGVVTTVIHSLR